MEDEKLKAICDKLTDEEITYLTIFLSAKIMEKLTMEIMEIGKQYGKH